MQIHYIEESMTGLLAFIKFKFYESVFNFVRVFNVIFLVLRPENLYQILSKVIPEHFKVLELNLIHSVIIYIVFV